MSFRKEEKLKVHKGQLLSLLNWISENGGEILYESRTVSSTYFDTENWRMFNDSEEGSVPRKKIRVRSYSRDAHDEFNSALEVKTSAVEGRYKTATPHFDLPKIMKLGVFDSDYGVCKPKVRVTYQRTYYKIRGIRLTIDQNIEYARADGNRNSAFKIVDPEIAVELKADDEVSIEFLNSHFPFERVRFSKYSRAVNAVLTNSAIVF